MAATITGVTGTLTKGESVVITGSDFGIKAVAAPLLWDDFEEGVSDQVIPNDSDPSQTDSWTFNVGSVVYSNEHSRTGSTLSSKHDLSGDGITDPYGRLRKIYWQTDASLKKVFVSFWVRYSWGYTDVLHQTKLWRIGNIANTVMWKNGHWMNPPSRSSIAMRQMVGGEIQAYYHNVHPADGEWFRVEFQAEQSQASVSDGSIEQWHTQPTGPILKIIDLSSVMTTASEEWDTLEIGQACTNMDAGISSGVINYFDDVYLDNTWARVVIGDASTYDNCTTRETQIPSAWATGEITVTFNAGAFTDETAYLFVVDSDGAVSNGYEIVVGEAADVNPPFVDQQSPTDGSTDVSIDAPIVCHIKDVGDGVDISTIVMTVNEVEVEPVITGTLANYTVTYTPLSPLAHSTEYTITMKGDDLVPNSMEQVSWSFTTEADVTPPTADTFSPEDEAVGVSINTVISCHVKDAGEGVDLDSIVMQINGVEVETVITGTSEDYTVTYTPSASLEYGTVYTVSINADDEAS